ncbi:MAG: penicillin acylase family protein [Vicinamibacterales bacterium]
MSRTGRLAASLAVSITTLVAQPRPDVHALARTALAQIDGDITVAGLRAEVQVLRDTWGVPHITAQSTDDLFLAQGYVMAQDRLWQMEMWRRAAEGRMAEIAGAAAVERDRAARLLRYRGPFDASEWASYHPDGERIFSSFANGVNAFIAQHRNRLPVEFVMTGVVPEPWTIEQLVMRPPSFGDAVNELELARSVARSSAAQANRAMNPDPPDDLVVPDGVDLAAVSDEVIASVRSGAVVFPQLLPQYRPLAAAGGNETAIREPGSNNWVVSAARSATGHPVVANDPHREVTNPSLRYIVHLQAPGWNVAGAGEPPFVGVALGHNERIAWGLTIVGTDQEDVYVETVNPADANEVSYNGAWEAMRIVSDTIKVQGAADAVVQLKYSRHGPIFFEDKARHLAYAVRRAADEPGTAPYLAGLRLAQARDCREFLDAAMYWKAPTENHVCGDVEDNISWRPAALSPARKGWTGRLPVPGTGRYEWRGFRSDLPSEYNPPRGYIATANHNINPPGYTPPLMFKNADTRFERITRLRQLLEAPPHKISMDDHKRMQHDALSLRAVEALRSYRGWTATNQTAEKARALLAAWNGVYARDSVAAALYASLTTRPALAATRELLPADPTPAQIEARLLAIVGNSKWSSERWGQRHTRAFRHPLVREFDLPTVERSGGAGTVAADGATYREILDVSDWDRSQVINVPGQSGQPSSPYYGNLLTAWADNGYFSLAFTRKAVQAAAQHRLTLRP